MNIGIQNGGIQRNIDCNHNQIQNQMKNQLKTKTKKEYQSSNHQSNRNEEDLAKYYLYNDNNSHDIVNVNSAVGCCSGSNIVVILMVILTVMLIIILKRVFSLLLRVTCVKLQISNANKDTNQY